MTSLRIASLDALIAYNGFNADVARDLQLWRLLQTTSFVNGYQQLSAEEWASVVSSGLEPTADKGVKSVRTRSMRRGRYHHLPDGLRDDAVSVQWWIGVTRPPHAPRGRRRKMGQHVGILAGGRHARPLHRLVGAHHIHP